MKSAATLVFGLLLFVLEAPAYAQISGVLSGRVTTNTYNTDNDFDLYFRNPTPETKYFIEFLLDDGTVEDDGPYDSQNRASEVLFFKFEHGLMPVGTVSTEIVIRDVLPPFVYFGRFDTCWEAMNYAHLLEQGGLQTSIVCVDVRPKFRPVKSSSILRIPK